MLAVTFILGAAADAALVSAFGLPRWSTGRSGSFSSGDDVAGGGVAVGGCALASDVSPPRVGRDVVLDEEEEDESFRVGRSESLLDGAEDEAEGDEFFSVGRPESSFDAVEDDGEEFFRVGRSVSSLDD